MRLVDMTHAKAALGLLKAAGIRATFTHLIVRAAAIALARNPESHQIVCGYRRLTPGSVDIGLSMAGETTYAPVVVLPSMDKKPLGELVEFSNEAIVAAREKEAKDLKSIRRIGCIVPFGFLRRFVLRLLQGTFWFRRRLAGTFQVSCLPGVDMVAPLLFYTGSLLGAGSVSDRVVAVDGAPAVRPTVWLTLCADHVAMDGRRGVKLLEAIKGVLEGQELVGEAVDAVALRRGGAPEASAEARTPHRSEGVSEVAAPS